MKPTVVLDPGHGGRDPGAVAHGLKEKNLNLKLARKVAERLEGVKVLLTRESDIYVALKDRVALAARSEAGLFVSLHANAGGGHGFESYIYGGLGAGDPAAFCRNIIHDEIMNVLSRWDIRDRGKKSAAFYVLKHNRAPALLLESLFMDNKQEAALWREPPFVEALAGAVASGIKKALGIEVEEELLPVNFSGGKNTEKAKDDFIAAVAENENILYTVQVGAFAYRENARRCLEKARSSGFGDAFIYPKRLS